MQHQTSAMQNQCNAKHNVHQQLVQEHTTMCKSKPEQGVQYCTSPKLHYFIVIVVVVVVAVVADVFVVGDDDDGVFCSKSEVLGC